MTQTELFQTTKLELTHEYERLQRLIQESREKLLKTEGALLLLGRLEREARSSHTAGSCMSGVVISRIEGNQPACSSWGRLFFCSKTPI